MNSTATLTGAHQRTYNAILKDPPSRDLERDSVRSLLKWLGHAAEEPNGTLKVTRNGKVVVLLPPGAKAPIEPAELMALRQFFGHPEAGNGDKTHWLLVIDHHEARIFRSEMGGAVPLRVSPHEPGDYFRHAHNSMDFARGMEKPDPNSFFEPVAQALELTGPILIFGNGTGTSSEMDLFVAWLKRHHPKTAERVIGSVVVDGHHRTQDQLLAKAREIFAGSQVA